MQKNNDNKVHLDSFKMTPVEICTQNWHFTVHILKYKILLFEGLFARLFFLPDVEFFISTKIIL